MGKIRNQNTDEPMFVYRYGTMVMIAAGEMGPIALTPEDARALARQLMRSAGDGME